MNARMQRLNAIDCISPAFTRTHALLFKPFRIGRTWKLTATAYLGFAGSFFFPFPLLYAIALLAIPGIPRAAMPFLWAAAFVASAIYFAVFYCCVRLQLVEFEMVLTTSKRIAPMWRKYSTKVWPWIAAKVLVSILSAAIMAPIVIASGTRFMAVFLTLQSAGPHPSPEIMSQVMASFFGIYGLMILLFFIPKTLATLLDDFVLPFFLLEDLPLSAALSRGLSVSIADPLGCLLYLALKFFLAIFGYIAQSIAMQICMIPVVIVGAILAVLGGLLFNNAGPSGHLLEVAGAVMLCLVFFAAITYVAIGAFGYLLLLFDSYALYFLGGRYPLLGNFLDPGPGGTFTPPPVFPSPEENDDSDGGPPMPMNPAVA